MPNEPQERHPGFPKKKPFNAPSPKRPEPKKQQEAETEQKAQQDGELQEKPKQKSGFIPRFSGL